MIIFATPINKNVAAKAKDSPVMKGSQKDEHYSSQMEKNENDNQQKLKYTIVNEELVKIEDIKDISVSTQSIINGYDLTEVAKNEKLLQQKGGILVLSNCYIRDNIMEKLVENWKTIYIYKPINPHDKENNKFASKVCNVSIAVQQYSIVHLDSNDINIVRDNFKDIFTKLENYRNVYAHTIINTYNLTNFIRTPANIINTGNLAINLSKENFNLLMRNLEFSPNVQRVEINIENSETDYIMVRQIYQKFRNYNNKQKLIIKINSDSDSSINNDKIQEFEKNNNTIIIVTQKIEYPSSINSLATKEEKDMAKKAWQNINRLRKTSEEIFRNAKYSFEIAVGDLINNKSTQNDRGKEMKILRILSQLPLGRLPPLLKKPHICKSILSGINQLINDIDPKIDPYLKDMIIKHITRGLMDGNWISLNPLCLIGPAGTGKTYTAKIPGYIVAYIHAIIYAINENTEVLENYSNDDIDQLVQDAIIFAKKNVDAFFAIVDLSKASNANILTGSPKVFVGADVGILKFINKVYVDENGIEKPIYYMVLVYDEFDKAPDNKKEGSVLTAAMTFDTMSYDEFSKLSFILSNFALIVYCGNKQTEGNKPFMSRLKTYIVDGFDPYQKKPFIKKFVDTQLKEQSNKTHLGELEAIYDKDDNIVILANNRTIGNILSEAIHQILVLDKSEIGLRNIKKRTDDICMKITQAHLCDDKAEITVIDANTVLDLELSNVKNEDFLRCDIGKSIYTAIDKDEISTKTLKVTIESQSSGQSGTVVNIPGGLQNRNEEFQTNNNNNDVFVNTCYSLLEMIKENTSFSNKNNGLSLTTTNMINNKINKLGAKHIISQAVFNTHDVQGTQNAATSLIMAYISLILQIPQEQHIVLGHCDITGELKSRDNAAAAIKSALNAIFPTKENPLIVIVPPKGNINPQEKYKINKQALERIKFVEASNIFEIIKIVFPSLK